MWPIVNAQSIELPDLTSLPNWVQVIFYVTFAVGTAITILAARFGLLRSRSSINDHSKAEVAAVIVDSSAINRLTIAAEALNLTFQQLNITGKASSRAVGAQAREVNTLNKSVTDLTESLDRLRDELIRAAASRE